MNLVFTTTAYLPSIGGAQIYQHCLAKALSEKYKISVLCHWDKNRNDWLLGTTLKAPTQTREYVYENIPVRRLGLSAKEKLSLAPYLPIYYPWMNVALAGMSPVLERHVNDISQNASLIHNMRIGREGLSYASLSVARKHKIPFVFTPFHHPRWVGWRYKAYLQIYHEADLLFTLTNHEKDFMLSLGIAEERVAVTGMGPLVADNACPSAFLEKYGIDGPMVLFLGQHYEYKGFRQVLEATKAVWETAPDTHFVFVGPAVGDSEEAFKENADRRIHRLGNLDLQEKTNGLSAAYLLCVPSTQESFGGVYTEAWCFKKPVIGGNIASIAEVIDEGKNGYLVNQNAHEIAERITYLLAHPDLAQEMGEEGYRKVHRQYTWERIAHAAETAYQRVL